MTGNVIVLLARPLKLEKANIAAATSLWSLAMLYDIEVVIADLPMRMEKLLSEINDPEELMRRAVELGLIPASQSFIRPYRPILKSLCDLIKSGVDVKCCLASNAIKDQYEVGVKALRLMLKASIRGVDNIDLNEWLKLLEDNKLQVSRRISDIVNAISRAGNRRVIALTGLEGIEVSRTLKKMGLSVKMHIVGLPYLYTPIEVMYKRYSQGSIKPSELKKLIEEHINYIKNYVLRHDNLDEAHQAWSMDKAPWLTSFIRWS